MPMCPLCHKETDTLYHIAEQAVIDLIKRNHPEWVEPDGACKKCIEYYESLDDAVSFE
jgi:hypothetical protein